MDNGELSHQAEIAMVVSYFFQVLKGAPWFSWVTIDTKRLNRIVGLVIAAVTGVGAHLTFDHASGVYTIVGNLYTLLHVCWTGLIQWVMQEMSYQVVKVGERSKMRRVNEEVPSDPPPAPAAAPVLIPDK